MTEDSIYAAAYAHHGFSGNAYKQIDDSGVVLNYLWHFYREADEQDPLDCAMAELVTQQRWPKGLVHTLHCEDYRTAQEVNDAGFPAQMRFLIDTCGLIRAFKDVRAILLRHLPGIDIPPSELSMLPPMRLEEEDVDPLLQLAAEMQATLQLVARQWPVHDHKSDPFLGTLVRKYANIPLPLTPENQSIQRERLR